jgi:hypothetical protein
MGDLVSASLDSTGVQASAERLVQEPGTTLAHPAMGRLSGWSGQYLEQSGGVDACGEAEKSLRQLVGGLHGGVVAHAVE